MSTFSGLVRAGGRSTAGAIEATGGGDVEATEARTEDATEARTEDATEARTEEATEARMEIEVAATAQPGRGGGDSRASPRAERGSSARARDARRGSTPSVISPGSLPCGNRVEAGLESTPVVLPKSTVK